LVEIKHHRDHSASMEHRIAKKLDSSCDSKNSDVYTTQGTGPQRVHTSIHYSGSAKQHGPDNKGEAGIDGQKRSMV
jgi:hypothetical protein